LKNNNTILKVANKYENHDLVVSVAEKVKTQLEASKTKEVIEEVVNICLLFVKHCANDNSTHKNANSLC